MLPDGCPVRSVLPSTTAPSLTPPPPPPGLVPSVTPQVKEGEITLMDSTGPPVTAAGTAENDLRMPIPNTATSGLTGPVAAAARRSLARASSKQEQQRGGRASADGGAGAADVLLDKPLSRVLLRQLSSPAAPGAATGGGVSMPTVREAVACTSARCAVDA